MSPDQPLADWARAAVPRAVAYARTLLPPGRDHQAEDLVADALCRLLARARHYDLPADGDRLLFRSVSNACINATTRRRELASLDGELRRSPDSPDSALTLADTLAGDPADEPERRAMTTELAGRIDRSVASLPALQRAVISLRALGRSPGEVADALALSANHVAVLTHRARAALAAGLADVLDEDAG